MIVIPKQQIQFLVAGRAIEGRTKGKQRVVAGRNYHSYVEKEVFVLDRHGNEKKKIINVRQPYRVRVIAIEGDRVVVSHYTDEKPRFLAAAMGRANYVSDPLMAAQGESQALSRADQEQMSKPAFERDDAMRRERVKVDGRRRQRISDLR